jgi:sugar phosphate isomerase/epimerase
MRYTRREVGKLALMGLPGAAWLARSPLLLAAQADAKPNSRWAGVDIGMNVPYNFDHSNRMSGDEVLSRCVQLGASVVELRSQPVEAFMGAPAPVSGSGRGMTAEQRAARDAAAAALDAWRKSAPMDRARAFRQQYEAAGVRIAIVKFDGIFAMSDDAVDYCFALAKTLGARAISCEISVPDTKRLGQFADKHQMMVGYHGHDDTTPADWEQAFSYAKYNGANVDLGHFVSGNDTSPIPFITEYHDRVTHVHVKDMKMHRGPAVPFGEGDVPLKEALQLIRDRHWPIPGIIEFEYRVPAGSTAMDEMAKCMAYTKACLV